LSRRLLTGPGRNVSRYCFEDASIVPTAAGARALRPRLRSRARCPPRSPLVERSSHDVEANAAVGRCRSRDKGDHADTVRAGYTREHECRCRPSRHQRRAYRHKRARSVVQRGRPDRLTEGPEAASAKAVTTASAPRCRFWREWLPVGTLGTGCSATAARIAGARGRTSPWNGKPSNRHSLRAL
jgi:hypothetical protein